MQSRYYNPAIGRFINADALVSTGQGTLGNNMFAYCRSNPVRRVDISGNYDEDLLDSDGNPATNEEDRGKSSTGYQGTPIVGQGGGGSRGPSGSPNVGQPNSSGQYHAPTGGGGVTNSYDVDGITVDFGHGGRHVDTDSINLTELEKSIANDVVNRPPSYNQATSVYDFMYAGRPLYYSYYTRDNSHINIGTYYFMDQLR